VAQFRRTFFVAQAFTPGNERKVIFKSPINGALVVHSVPDPDVNAWATENVKESGAGLQLCNSYLGCHACEERSCDKVCVAAFE
jgi:hypothetical protein